MDPLTVQLVWVALPGIAHHWDTFESKYLSDCERFTGTFANSIDDGASGTLPATALALEMTMTAEPKKRWHTPDFELRFKKAMGRDMTPEEREFFGLDCADSKESQESDTQPNSNRSEYAWQALRRISALMG